MSDRLPIAPNGVFVTVQGEGALLGVPMVFVRLAGCSVGCPECDTDYRVDRRLTAREIVREVASVLPTSGAVEWVWITGGEPTDHDVEELAAEFRRLLPLKLALCTAGVRSVAYGVFDWLSVSPHDPERWEQRQGQEVKLVAGLNRLRLDDFARFKFDLFPHRFVAPAWGRYDAVEECRAWVMNHPGWRMTTQAHKSWCLP